MTSIYGSGYVADIHSCSYYCERPECIKAQRDELRAQVDALRADAERYRWIRCRTSAHRAVDGFPVFAFPSYRQLSVIGDIMRGSVAQHIDDAIDAAMGKPTE